MNMILKILIGAGLLMPAISPSPAHAADADWSGWRVTCDHPEAARRRSCAAFAIGPDEQFLSVGRERGESGWGDPTLSVYHRWGDREFAPALRIDRARALYLEPADAETIKLALGDLAAGKRVLVTAYRMPTRQRYEYAVPLQGFAESLTALMQMTAD